MNKNIFNILKEKIKKNKNLKTEISIKIKKSIIQNNNINNKLKIFSKFFLVSHKRANTHISRQHKICIYTGKRSGIHTGFNFSRYKIKNLILDNKLTNFKKNNW